MMDWRESLAGVDVDYLVGISNKGIVKRAYKDLEAGGNEAQAVAGLDWTAQELTVEAGGEAVTIRFPLSESRCSCPSRSICRHVIMAILLAQQAAASEAGDGECRALSETITENGECRASSETATENGECRAPSEAATENGECIPSSETATASGECRVPSETTTENGECRSSSEAASRSGECIPSSEAASRSGECRASSETAAKNSECRALSKATGGTDYAECCAEESATVSGVSQSKSQVKSFGGDRQGDGRAEGVGGGSLAMENSQVQEKTKGKSDEKGSSDLGQLVWQEILAHSRKPLFRALGSKGMRRLAAAMEAGNVPRVECGTVVRVQLPGQDMTVKLLSPLAYSTCTCHKKELCSHKAEAILWCQYLKKQLTAQELSEELEQEPAFDLQELQSTAGQVRACLEHLLETGLARSGAEQAQELERLAILCHNAGLPGWEGDIRALAEGYEKYLRRAAGQTMEKLAGQLQRLYDKTMQLDRLAVQALSDQKSPGVGTAEQEESERNAALCLTGGITGRIQALAREFRSEYLPVGDLELTGITVEHFVSDSGYEGDTVYFLEMATGTWYTYTNARPTFYEGKKRRGYQEKAAAPWGVSLPLEALANVRLQLRGAKCDAQGRLSSSQETKGEILGKSELTAAMLEGWYYRKYDRLFAEQIPRPGKKRQLEKGTAQQAEGSAALSGGNVTESNSTLSGGNATENGSTLSGSNATESNSASPGGNATENGSASPGNNVATDRSSYPRLVFVQAARFEKGRFNEITQKLELPIWDEEGRKVLVELPYTKRDEASIRYLERLKQKQQPCFLGKLYLQGSQVCLHPVDVLERQEMEAWETAEGAGGRNTVSAEGTETHIGKTNGVTETCAGKTSGVNIAADRDRAACQTLQDYLEEVSWLLQEIYQVGSATVQDSTLEALKRAEKLGTGYGMTTLSDWLGQLSGQLAQSRHQLKRQLSESMDIFCRLWQYVQLCRQRTAYDLAFLSYRCVKS